MDCLGELLTGLILSHITALSSLSGLVTQTNLRLTANTAGTNQSGLKKKPSEIPTFTQHLFTTQLFYGLSQFWLFRRSASVLTMVLRTHCVSAFLWLSWTVTDSNSLNSPGLILRKFYVYTNT